MERRVRQAARLVGLDTHLDRLPSAPSGGQQQRAVIVRALAREVALVLMDEPLANLDYKLREELREELPRICRPEALFERPAHTFPGISLARPA